MDCPRFALLPQMKTLRRDKLGMVLRQYTLATTCAVRLGESESWRTRLPKTLTARAFFAEGVLSISSGCSGMHDVIAEGLKHSLLTPVVE